MTKKKKAKVIDLYSDEYKIKPKAKKKVKPSKTDDQGRHADPYGDGGPWLS